VNRKRCGPDVNRNRLFLERIKELVAARQQRREGDALRSRQRRRVQPHSTLPQAISAIWKFGDVPDDLSAL